ncbi:MAG TPA: hypothetical protein VGH49_13280 [Xanthobacteraceae bacterium]
MTVSRAFPVFSIAFAVIYVASVQYNLALFTYHPEIAQWGPLVQAPRQGPAMYWYGWLATSAIGSAALAALSLALPARMLDRACSVLVWLVPIAMIGVIGYILRGYFLR